VLDLCHVTDRYPMAAFFLTLHGCALAQAWLTVQDSFEIKKFESPECENQQGFATCIT